VEPASSAEAALKSNDLPPHNTHLSVVVGPSQQAKVLQGFHVVQVTLPLSISSKQYFSKRQHFVIAAACGNDVKTSTIRWTVDCQGTVLVLY
jgi:hypothetical protein